jgi:hypothetical protein
MWRLEGAKSYLGTIGSDPTVTEAATRLTFEPHLACPLENALTNSICKDGDWL